MAKEYVEERNGGYCVTRTRVSLDSIVQCFNEGLSPEAILGEFETLSLAQVFGAITCYLENQPAIDLIVLLCQRGRRRRSADQIAGTFCHRCMDFALFEVAIWLNITQIMF